MSFRSICLFSSVMCHRHTPSSKRHLSSKIPPNLYQLFFKRLLNCCPPQKVEGTTTRRPGIPFQNRSITLRCANMTAPGRATQSLSGGCGFRCGRFRTPGGSGHQLVITGTREGALGYQPSYIWRLVQGMAFRGTNGGRDNSLYRKAASRVQ